MTSYFPTVGPMEARRCSCSDAAARHAQTNAPAGGCVTCVGLPGAMSAMKSYTYTCTYS